MTFRWRGCVFVISVKFEDEALGRDWQGLAAVKPLPIGIVYSARVRNFPSFAYV
jgi:hypothetical protein